MNTKLILAALMMSASLAACGQREEAPADATTEPAPPADTAPVTEAPPAETAPMDSTTPDGTTPPADATATPPAEGDAAEPAPAQ